MDHVASDADDEPCRESTTMVIARGRLAIATSLAHIADEVEKLKKKLSDSGWPPPLPTDDDPPPSSTIVPSPSVH